MLFQCTDIANLRLNRLFYRKTGFHGKVREDNFRIKPEGVAKLSVQLHTYSDYSLYRSAFTVERLVLQAKKLGIKNLALTDYNTTAGHVELEAYCEKYGIKPIFGAELTIAYPAKFCVQNSAAVSPLVLLAANNKGYTNLLHLTSFKPPLPLFEIKAFSEGLLLLEGGFQGQLYGLLQGGKKQAAQALHKWYEEIFSDHYYLRFELGGDSLLLDNFPEEKFVLTQKVCYGADYEREVLEILAKIGRLKITPPPFPFLNWEKLKMQFTGPKLIIENTLQVAKLCQVELAKQRGLPVYSENGATFKKLVWEGAKVRYPQLTHEVSERIEHELAVVKKMGFVSYFLIVAHIVRFAKEAKIPVGPGRGSAAGSIIAYCLGITSVDPLAWGLLFERFLNPERRNRPDIDLDFCYQRREEVLAHVAEHFGRDHVAQIGTYGTFGKRSARLEVQKVLEGDSNKVAHFSQQIRGLKTHRATHAAGLVITPDATRNITAVFQDRKLPVTHLDMYSLEKLGVLKIDLLGLRTLTLLARMEAEIQKRIPSFTLGDISREDEKTFRLLSEGRSLGIFQLESPLYQELLRSLRPNSLKDLVALLALGRPGPLNIFPKFLELRRNPEKIHYPHPALQEILGETYGLILYQEQVMLIAYKIGQLSLGEADLLRTALGKKDLNSIQKWRIRFVDGARDFGLKKAEGENLFQKLLDFSGYAFNKAHSVSYAQLTWTAAYLKANYPLEFFLSILNEGVGHKEKSAYLLDCQRANVSILPPDVSFSERKCRAEGPNLRLGLNTISGLNPQEVQRILHSRQQSQFQNLADFKVKVALSEKVVETLILAGALDSLGERSGHLQSLGTKLPSRLQMLRKERELIGFFASEHPVAPFLPFLRNIQGEHATVAGEVLSLEQSRGKLRGILDTPEGSQPFQVAWALESRFLQEGAMVCLFGRRKQGVLFAEKVFPLNPILLVLPKKDELELVKGILQNEKGLRPVVLRLGQDILHPLPSEFWVEKLAKIEQRLQEAGVVYQWFDPWKENVT